MIGIRKKLNDLKELYACEKGYNNWEQCINDQANYMVEKIMNELALRLVKNNGVLADVSQQRELLVAYEKQHYTPSEWALASKQCEKEIDDFLATNCG